MALHGMAWLTMSSDTTPFHDRLQVVLVQTERLLHHPGSEGGHIEGNHGFIRNPPPGMNDIAE